MKFDLVTLLQIFAFVQAVVEKGSPAWEAVKKAALDNGVDSDTALLDGVILDAARQKALAEREFLGDNGQ
jgi:hypothetical protein